MKLLYTVNRTRGLVLVLLQTTEASVSSCFQLDDGTIAEFHHTSVSYNKVSQLCCSLILMTCVLRNMFTDGTVVLTCCKGDC